MDENKMPENDGWKKNARLAIYAMSGSLPLGMSRDITLALDLFTASIMCLNGSDTAPLVPVPRSASII